MISLCRFALLVSSAIGVICACGHQSVPPPRLEYELVGPEQQAYEAVYNTPTDFIVAFPEENLAWERAYIFLDTYSAGALVDTAALQIKSREDSKYVYKIQRSLAPGGYRYHVECAAWDSGGVRIGHRSQREQAILNAKNLARFVAEGKLEVSLLDY